MRDEAAQTHSSPELARLQAKVREQARQLLRKHTENTELRGQLAATTAATAAATVADVDRRPEGMPRVGKEARIPSDGGGQQPPGGRLVTLQSAARANTTRAQWVASIEKENLAARRKIECMSKEICKLRKDSQASKEVAEGLQRKFLVGSQSTVMLRKNAELQRQLGQAEHERIALTRSLRKLEEEDTCREVYVAHLRMVLELRASELGLDGEQTDVLEELARLQTNYRALLQEIACYEDRCAEDQRAIRALREQASQLQAYVEDLQGQLAESERESKAAVSQWEQAMAEQSRLRGWVAELEGEKARLTASINEHAAEHARVEGEGNGWRARAEAAEARLTEARRREEQQEQLVRGREQLVQEVERLKGALAPLEAQARAAALEIDELSQQLGGREEEVARGTAAQEELMGALRTSQTERSRLQVQLGESMQTRTLEGGRALQLQAELDDAREQQRLAADSQSQELARLRRRVQDMTTELDRKASVEAHVAAQVGTLSNIVQRQPGCAIGAGTLDTCRRILVLEQQVKEFLELPRAEWDSRASGTDAAAAARSDDELAKAIADNVSVLSQRSTQVISDAVEADSMAMDRAHAQVRAAEKKAKIDVEGANRRSTDAVAQAETKLALQLQENARLREDNARLQAEAVQNRVNSVTICKLESEHQNACKLFEGKERAALVAVCANDGDGDGDAGELRIMPTADAATKHATGVLASRIEAVTAGKAAQNARITALQDELQSAVAARSTAVQEREIAAAKAAATIAHLEQRLHAAEMHARHQESAFLEMVRGHSYFHRGHVAASISAHTVDPSLHHGKHIDSSLMDAGRGVHSRCACRKRTRSSFWRSADRCRPRRSSTRLRSREVWALTWTSSAQNHWRHWMRCPWTQIC
jgi:hypothetical protein